MPSKAKPRKLGSLLKQAKTAGSRRRRRKTASKQSALSVKSISLTPGTLAELERLLEEASAALDRKVSASAVVRGLLKISEREELSEEVLREVEAELSSKEVVWGRQAE